MLDQWFVFGIKTIEEKVVTTSSQIKHQARFDKSGLGCWNLPEINSTVSPPLLWGVGVVLQIRCEHRKKFVLGMMVCARYVFLWGEIQKFFSSTLMSF